MTRIIAKGPLPPGVPSPGPGFRSGEQVDGEAGDDREDLAPAPAFPPITLQATGGAGERLDRFLAARLPALLPPPFSEVSRTRVQRWIGLGAVLVDGRALPARARLMGIEAISVEPQPREADTAFVAQAIPLPIVWRDASLLVIDKPAGLVVHPAAGNWQGTMLNGLLHLDPALAELPRAGIVHRLDKDTSGLLVVARSESAMNLLAAQLADRSMGRRYLALVAGLPEETGLVDAPIGRDERSRVRMAVVPAGRGRDARTHFRRLAVGKIGERPITLLECKLQTGRTHQIRVHLAHLGFPLIGDGVYGGPPVAGIERQALHAWRLSLRHPADRKQREWTAAPPGDMCALLEQAGIDPAPYLQTPASQPRQGPEPGEEAARPAGRGGKPARGGKLARGGKPAGGGKR